MFCRRASVVASMFAAIPALGAPHSGHTQSTSVNLGHAEYASPDGVATETTHRRVWKPTCIDGFAPRLDVQNFEDRIARKGKPVAVVSSSSPERSGVELVFNLFGDVNAQNTQGLQDVADYYATQIQDNVTITIDVFLDPGNFGGTGVDFLEMDYTAYRAALIADLDPDDSVENLLPTTTLPVRFTFGGPVTQESRLVVCAANMRALGLSPSVTVDASIFVGSELDWDPSDGIGQPGQFGTFSGQDIMVHEVGHAIGFINVNEFGTALPTSLDAYRFAEVGAENPTNDAEFTAFPRALFIGSTNANQQHVLDVRSAEYLMSNASDFQASHFRENFSSTPIGRMDPAIAPAESTGPDYLLDSDRDAFDAIGWDLFSGPACFADCDANGALNIDDIDCFIDAFTSGDLAGADCDANGTLNIDDVDCFVASFVAGCP